MAETNLIAVFGLLPWVARHGSVHITLAETDVCSFFIDCQKWTTSETHVCWLTSYLTVPSFLVASEQLSPFFFADEDGAEEIQGTNDENENVTGHGSVVVFVVWTSISELVTFWADYHVLCCPWPNFMHSWNSFWHSSGRMRQYGSRMLNVLQLPKLFEFDCRWLSMPCWLLL